MEATPKWYDAHLETHQDNARIKGRNEYEALYEQSLEDPDGFWAEQAMKYLSWDKPWDFVLQYDFSEGRIEWFCGGIINAAKNCLDRHLDRLEDHVAYNWEEDNAEEKKVITYGQLYEQFNKMAAVLEAKGINKGDRVIIYMP